LEIKQDPPIEGVSDYLVNGKLIAGLGFQKGSVFATIMILDAFNQLTTIQLHHSGHTKAWLSKRTTTSARIRLFSYDGVRLRILYHLPVGNSGTVVYLRKPFKLFRSGTLVDFPTSVKPIGLEKEFLVEGTKPLGPLESEMVKHGRYYGTGRIGAEVSYSIPSKMLGADGLILNEPARRGADLFTPDRRILAESRFISAVPAGQLQNQIALELVRLAKRLRNDFRWNSDAEVGYAILSHPKGGGINSLVAELPRPK
jgi:hypothetical protein